jgi:hypothetical protein
MMPAYCIFESRPSSPVAGILIVEANSGVRENISLLYFVFFLQSIL